MLFNSPNMAEYASAKSMDEKPGINWYYSSGTSNIISNVLKKRFESEIEYLLFPFERLFGPLEINSAVFETDAANTYVASSYLFMNARDWAKFGLFF